MKKKPHHCPPSHLLVTHPAPSAEVIKAAMAVATAEGCQHLIALSLRINGVACQIGLN